MRRRIQIGDRFGQLTVIAKGRKKDNFRFYVVQCDCGSALKEVVGTSLLSGVTKSCGCLRQKAWREIGKSNRKYPTCLLCDNPIVCNHGLCYSHFLCWKRGALTEDQQKTYEQKINLLIPESPDTKVSAV